MPTSQKNCNCPERMNDAEYLESLKAKKSIRSELMQLDRKNSLANGWNYLEPKRIKEYLK